VGSIVIVACSWSSTLLLSMMHGQINIKLTLFLSDFNPLALEMDI